MVKKGGSCMPKLQDPIGWVYIAEETSPIENTVGDLQYTERNGVSYAEFDTCLQTFEEINRNRRQYLSDNISNMIFKSDRIQTYLRDNAWFGEMDHPTQQFQNSPLTPERISAIWMPNRSHKILKPEFRGNELVARIQTSSGTEAGRGMACEIIQGLIPSFSCRAMASLENVNSKPTVIVKNLITYDWVLYPSHATAHMKGSATIVDKAVRAVGESAESIVDYTKNALKRFKKYSENVEIPLGEILERVGVVDPTVSMVLESFELDASLITGFTEDTNQAIIRDGDNMLYVNMNPSTKKEIHDFLSSY